MRILHIAPNAPYNDNWGYQDNLLPKYHKKMGNEVTIIVPNKMHGKNGIEYTEECTYFLDDGVKVIRKRYNDYKISSITNLLTKMDVYDEIVDCKPDFVFFHGLVSSTIFDVVKYQKKENPSCVVVEDNHLDYNIGSQSKGVKKLIGRGWFRLRNKLVDNHISRVYGVTPWRKEYAEEYFGVPRGKTDVLIMGADDDKMHLNERGSLREETREKHQIANEDFLIVTGGKIDKKKKTDLLIRACTKIQGCKLLIFGSVSEDMKKEFDELIQNPNVIYIGWVNSDDVYRYFYAADLVVFPGQHSVLWEQACASKVPCLFERWEGMDHVNNGGNSDFVSPVSVETLFEKVEELHFTEKYYRMKAIADSPATDIYLYSKIAEKSLECIKNGKGST